MGLPRLPRLLRTANFRLATLYIVVFALSVALLSAIVFYSVESALEAQMRSHIDSEVSYLLSEYYEDEDEDEKDRRVEELREAIGERIEMTGHNRLTYHLQNRDGKVIFDEVPRIMAPYGWQQVTIPSRTEATGAGTAGAARPPATTRATEKTLLLHAVALPDGYVLAVGADLAPVHNVEKALVTASLWAFLATLLFGGVGGLLLSRRFLSKVDAITKAAERIGSGNLSERIPLRHTGDDLDHLVTTINGMLDRIEQLVGHIRQVSSNIAHDLRTPLGRLRQKLESLSEADGDAHLREEAANAALRQVDEILEIFSALLRIAEIEAGSIKSGFTPVDLTQVMENLVSAFQPVAAERGQSMVAALEPGIVIPADRGLLNQMFANLVENALQHTPAHTTVHLALKRNTREVIARVADNGPGVPPEHYDSIVKPFYRLEQSRTSPGNGLGLSLVTAIAELHGASIQLADNRPGLSVTLRFPAG
jgi:signal transduction histidine kinase